MTEHTYAGPFTHWVSTILACHMIWGDQPSPWGKSRVMDLGSPRGGGVHQRAAKGGPGLVPKRRKGTYQVHRILRSRALNMGGGCPQAVLRLCRVWGNRRGGLWGGIPGLRPALRIPVQLAGQPVKGVTTRLTAHVIPFYVQHATRKCPHLKCTEW